MFAPQACAGQGDGLMDSQLQQSCATPCSNVFRSRACSTVSCTNAVLTQKVHVRAPFVGATHTCAGHARDASCLAGRSQPAPQRAASQALSRWQLPPKWGTAGQQAPASLARQNVQRRMHVLQCSRAKRKPQGCATGLQGWQAVDCDEVGGLESTSTQSCKRAAFVLG